MPDFIEISTFCIELSGSAIEYASYALGALAASSNVLPNVNLKTAARILEQIYITLWSRDSFIQSFEKNENLKIKVVTKNEEASSKLLTRYNNGDLLLQLNDNILAVSEIMKVDCDIIKSTGTPKKEFESVSTDKYDDMMKRSQLDIIEFVESARMASTTDQYTQKPIISDRTLRSKTKAKRNRPEVQQDRAKKPSIKRARKTDQEMPEEMPSDSEPTELQDSTTLRENLCCLDCQPPYHGVQLMEELKYQAGKDAESIIFSVDIEHDCDDVDFELTEIAKDKQFRAYEFEQNLYQRSQLRITYNEMKGTLSINDIFIRSRACAERKAAENKDAQYIELNSKIVGVVGQAGIGKTTFTKMLVANTLYDEGYLGPVSFIFYLFVRNVDFDRCCTAFQFLVENALPNWQHTPECNQAILKQITRDKNVLVVIDGLDEVVLPCKDIPEVSIDEQTTPEIILLNLLSGGILPMARKVFTSRPEQMFNLGQPYIPEFIVRINGLGQDSQDKLGQQICGKAFQKVKSDMHYKSDLYLYCHIPIYCTMAYSYLFKKKEVTSVSPTLTSLLTSIFVDLVSASELLERGFELKSLGHLAWIGIYRKQFIFSKDMQKQVGLDPELVKVFTNHTLLRGLYVSILEGRQLTFSHLTWQEFLAAIYFFLDDIQVDFESTIRNREVPEVMLKCLFGLCNQYVFYQLKQIFPELSVNKWILKKSLLCKHMIEKHGSVYQQKYEYFHLFWEAQDESMLAEFLNKAEWQSKIPLYGQWFPVDVVSLCYVLRAVQKRYGNVKEVVAISGHRYQNCTFENNAFERLADEIKSGIKIDTLILSEFPLKEDCWKSISRSVHLFKHLHVERCKITHEGLPNLVDNLSKLDDPITELKLGGNKLTDAGAELLAPGIAYIKELHLDDCDITHVGVEKVVQGLKDSNAQLDHLSLAGNKIGNEGAAVLAKDLHRLKGLNLLMCHITEDGVVKLAAKAKRLKQPMNLLDLSQNVIGQKGVDKLSLCGGKIRKLVLRFCDLTEDQQKQLYDHKKVWTLF